MSVTINVSVVTYIQSQCCFKIQEHKFFSKGHEEQHCSSSSKSVSCIINNINCSKIISQRNNQWTSAQKKKEKGRKKKNKKQKIIQNTQKKLLQACKTWGDPCITPNELELCIQNKPDISEKIVKSELSYYVHPHQSKRNMEPTLFKIMIQHDECLESLLLFLIDKNSLVNSSHASVLDLPTKDNLSKKVFRLCN